MDGWLDEEQDSPFIEVVDGEGEGVGWLLRREANLLHLLPQIIETPPRYLEDPYVAYHVQLIDERGLFKDGRDLNDVQMVLLSSALINRRKAIAKKEESAFEEAMLINNPTLYQTYMDKKQERKEVEGDGEIEQRVPGSVEEFLATVAAFSEGDLPDSNKEQEKAEGWLAGFLSNDELSEMDD